MSVLTVQTGHWQKSQVFESSMLLSWNKPVPQNQLKIYAVLRGFSSLHSEGTGGGFERKAEYCLLHPIWTRDPVSHYQQLPHSSWLFFGMVVCLFLENWYAKEQSWLAGPQNKCVLIRPVLCQKIMLSPCYFKQQDPANGISKPVFGQANTCNKSCQKICFSVPDFTGDHCREAPLFLTPSLWSCWREH